MARKAEATLWMRIKIGERSVMKRLAKRGRSYVPILKNPTNSAPIIFATRKMRNEFGKPSETTLRLRSRSSGHVKGH